MDGHATETMGYLVIYMPQAAGSVDVGGALLPYVPQQTQLNHQWTPVLGQQLKLQEEQSRDRETWHTKERVYILQFGAQLFG